MVKKWTIPAHGYMEKSCSMIELLSAHDSVDGPEITNGWFMFCISVNSEHNPAFLRAFLLKWGNVELILEECVFAKGVKPSTNEVNNQQIQTINIGDGRIPGTWIDESSDTCHRSLRTTLKFCPQCKQSSRSLQNTYISKKPAQARMYTTRWCIMNANIWRCLTLWKQKIKYNICWTVEFVLKQKPGCTYSVYCTLALS